MTALSSPTAPYLPIANNYHAKDIDLFTMQRWNNRNSIGEFTPSATTYADFDRLTLLTTANEAALWDRIMTVARLN